MSNGKVTTILERADATEELIVKAASEGHKSAGHTSTREIA